MKSKLVRDKIPDTIRNEGRQPIIYTANNQEYKSRLIEKLNEECNEFIKDKSIDELVDILEVVYALARALGITKEELEKRRIQKVNTRGSFEKRYILSLDTQ